MRSHEAETRATSGDDPLTCDELRAKLSELEAEKAELQSELVGPPPASGGAKWTLLRAINALNMEIARYSGRYADQCGPPRPQPLSTTLVGDGSFHTNAILVLHDPPAADVLVELVFDAYRRTVVLNAFQDVHYLIAVANKPIETVTIKLFEHGPGSFWAASGALSLPVRLQVSHSAHVSNAEAVLTLRTDGNAAGVVGKPLDRTTGRIALAGDGTFAGGFPLDGASCEFGIKGQLLDLP